MNSTAVECLVLPPLLMTSKVQMSVAPVSWLRAATSTQCSKCTEWYCSDQVFQTRHGSLPDVLAVQFCHTATQEA